MADLSDTIESNAEGPKRVTGDAGSVEQHSIKDQIEADRYLNAKQSTSRKGFGLRFQKIIPPGAG